MRCQKKSGKPARRGPSLPGGVRRRGAPAPAGAVRRTRGIGPVAVSRFALLVRNLSLSGLGGRHGLLRPRPARRAAWVHRSGAPGAVRRTDARVPGDKPADINKMIDLSLKRALFVMPPLKPRHRRRRTAEGGRRRNVGECHHVDSPHNRRNGSGTAARPHRVARGGPPAARGPSARTRGRDGHRAAPKSSADAGSRGCKNFFKKMHFSAHATRFAARIDPSRGSTSAAPGSAPSRQKTERACMMTPGNGRGACYL